MDSMQLRLLRPTTTVNPMAWGRIDILRGTGCLFAGVARNRPCGEQRYNYKDNHDNNDGNMFLLLVDDNCDGGK